MSEPLPKKRKDNSIEPPAMGEKRARWGFGYQDKAATARILAILRDELRTGSSSLEGIRLADLKAGRADDFVLVWTWEIQGNSIKWSGDAAPFNWGDLIGANGLIKELAEGYSRLGDAWPGRKIRVQLQSNRPAATERHRSQLVASISVAEFLKQHWLAGFTNHNSPEVDAVWTKIRQHAGVTESGFSDFVAACTFALGVPEPSFSESDSLDLRHFRRQFGELHKEIAIWVTNHPNDDFIPRDHLLRAIGYRGASSGLVQRFPAPQIPYEKNTASGEELRKLVAMTSGGYIAVSGAAGIGKSTLVQDVFSEHPFFVPYYAYLPYGEGNPRDRGEALTFFQDVVLRLDSFFLHRSSIGISDVLEGREALRQLMKKANELFVAKGHKTILLIDGVDHVVREVGLDRPIQLELPRPDEIPDGFLIILSAQPQGLLPGVLERHAADAVVAGSKRRVEVEGLSRAEVHTIVKKAGVNVSALEADELSNACGGNPLVLTYFLNSVVRSPGLTVGNAVLAAAEYKGSIEDYYRSALSVPLRDPATRNLLALLSRAAPNIPLRWIQTWPERIQFEHVYETTLAPFVRAEDGNLYFIHNSLVAFLRDETRSRLPGADLEKDERDFHSLLADRCGQVPCSDPLGRAKVFHLLRSGRNREVLNAMSSAWLRAAVEDFLPYDEIHALIRHGLESAWKLGAYGEALRMIMVGHELQQRSSRIEAEQLAATFLRLGRIPLAVTRIRSSGRVLVSDKVAVTFSRQLRQYASQKKAQGLDDLARRIYQQAKPVSAIYQAETVDTGRHDSALETLRVWAETAPLFEDAAVIVTQIQQVLFKAALPGEASPNDVKADLLHRGLAAAVDAGCSLEACRSFLNALRQMDEHGVEFAGLLRLYDAYPSGEALARLHELSTTIRARPELWLQFAWILYETKDYEQARLVVSSLKHIRFDYLNSQPRGFSDVSFTVELRCLQDLLGVDEGAVPSVENEREEAMARVEKAARLLGSLFGKVLKGESIASPPDVFRATLLFHNLPVMLSEYDWHQGYAVRQYRPCIYAQLLRLATRIGSDALAVLRNEFVQIVSGPASNQFSPECRRQFAHAFFENGVCDREEAVRLALSSEVDTTDEDPAERQSACLEIAVFFHSIGDERTADDWLSRAGKVSAGAGSHKDYHMAQLADWLVKSMESGLDSTLLLVLNGFFKALEVAGGAGSQAAATELLKGLLAVEPQRAASLAIDLIDREIINVSDALEAIVMGGASAKANPALLSAIYSEMLSLLHPGHTSGAAVAIVRSFPLDERIARARDLMNSVRTNCLPSRRITVARSIQDALRDDGLGDLHFGDGLRPGEDDSSRSSSLYKVGGGELLTTSQVAALLSDADGQDQWNSNPSENGGYDWWQAIMLAEVRDVVHMESLLSAVPVADYKTVETLAWKCKWYLTFGDRQNAEVVAKEAVDRAKESSWFERWDGAQLRAVYGMLVELYPSTSIEAARERFGGDLSKGRLHGVYLLDEIVDIFAFLRIGWPAAAVHVTYDYVKVVLSANRATLDFPSLTKNLTPEAIDHAICRFVARFLAFPVVDVGVAARRTLERYGVADGKGLVALLDAEPTWDAVQFEQLLAIVQVVLRARPNGLLRAVQGKILDLNRHDSIGVRAIARRISSEQGWQWREIRNLPETPSIVIPTKLSEEDEYEEGLVGDDLNTSLHLHNLVVKALEASGNDLQHLHSDYRRIYEEVSANYLWMDDEHLARWRKLVLARFWLHQRALIGREASLRLFGRRALCGRAPEWGESSYDQLYPIYDSALELIDPEERPVELRAMEWDWQNKQEEGWLRGENATEWSSYPKSIAGLHIIGERTLFIRPQWEWPREERYRGILDGSTRPERERDSLASQYELTYETYLRGEGQVQGALVVWNSERQLVGPAYRWIGIASGFARSLGWVPSPSRPFEWQDETGSLMVKSAFWRDGWIGLEPPRFESLGEGWLLLASDRGVEGIREARASAERHLWVERHSHGDKPYSGRWHLVSPF